MSRPTDLERLLALRQLRHRQAEDALLRQQARCDAAQAAADAARARVRAQEQRREERERTLLDGLVGRTVSNREIERLRIGLAVLDEHVACLARAEGEAVLVVEAELQRRGVLAEDRNRRRRECEKLSCVVAHAGRTARRRQELMADAEQEERVHVGAPARSRP